MEESDKTTALKKAYAEIILNTAKESAARVMVSDRKSARFHHDLSETKGEALRLLVRLKHMIDAKTIEADVISSNRQRQIDVLEAQLHEAEDIITDLRSEVRWVRDRLEKAKAFEFQERNLVNEEEEMVSAQKVDPEVVLESLNPDEEDRRSLHDVECEDLEKAKASESPERNLVNMEEEMVSVQKVDPEVVLESVNPDKEDRSWLDDVECENDENMDKSKSSESQERNLVNMEEETVSVHKVDTEVVLESVNSGQEDRTSLHDVECENDEKHFDGLSVVDTSMGSDVCESELDGDIRIKKLELSRNGCTQRIHALERKSSSSADEEEQQGTTEKDSEESLSSGKAGTLENTRCLVLALRASNAEVVTVPSNALGIKKSRKLRGKRKRRLGKPKAKSIRSQSQLIKPCQSQSNVICSKTSTSDGEDSMETHLSVESMEVDDLKTCKELKEHLQLKGRRSKNMHQTDPLVLACQESNLVPINVEDADDIPERETKIKRLPRLASRKEDVLISCEGEEDSVAPSTKIASNLVNLHPESKVTAAVSDQISESPPRENVNRLLKYTFQRKRKRGSTNINEDSNNLLRKHQENKAEDQTESTLSK